MAEVEKVQAAVLRFVDGLDRYGETSCDHQSFFASDLGRRAKALYYTNPLLGKLAVFPMNIQRGVCPLGPKTLLETAEIPIADAHYAMGFAFLSEVLGNEQYYRRAVHFLEVLKETRCPGYDHYCWGIRSIGKRGAAQCHRLALSGSAMTDAVRCRLACAQFWALWWRDKTGPESK